MRLKQALLCTLLFVLVRSNQYTSDYTCQHDGYAQKDGCHCTDYYGKKDCSQIQCLNSGVLAPFDREFDEDQRCSCPPGFLGIHCEPVHCVKGDVRSFEEVGGRDVSVIVTYNIEFQDQFASKDKGGPIFDTICKAVYGQGGVDENSRVHLYVMEQDILVTSLDDCKELSQYIVETSCEEVPKRPDTFSCEGTLSTGYIMKALNEMGEDSRLMIISNMGVDDFDNEEGIEAIRKKAISMRIQMHSLVISPREPQSNTVYFKDGFQRLRELSESTLGFFINPFDASGGQKLGGKNGDGITEILQNMMTVFFEYVVVDRVTTTEDSCKQTTDFTSFRALDDGTEFWLTVISTKAPFTGYTTGWVGGPGTPVPAISAGYFNAYTLTVQNTGDLTTYKPYSTQGSKCAPTTVMVLARSGHLARFAITNSNDYDATSPFAISGEKNTLVGHFTKHYHEENLETLNLEFIPGTGKEFDISKLDPTPSPRDCQYNAKFGDVSCEDGDDTFIRVRDTVDGAAITIQNLYCSPKDSAQFASSQFMGLLQDEPAPVCTPSNIIVKKDGRALIVAAHATYTIFGLFNGNKDSAIRYLNDLDDLNIYDQYIINIYNGEQATNTHGFDSYPEFKESLMSQWHDYKQTKDPADTDEQLLFDEECIADVSAVYPLEDLTANLNNAHPNSDIIFIYDRAITIDENDERNILKNAYSKRLRLIVLLLGCDDVDFSVSDALKKWQSLASKTGGFAVHFKEPSDLNKFFASYVDWVQGQTAAAIDNMAMDTGFIFNSPVTSTPFQVKQGGNYTIIVDSVPIAVDLTLSSGARIVNPTVLGNSITKFDYTANNDDTLTVTANPLQYFYYASIRVLDLNDDYATVGFTTSKDHGCVEKAYPDFNPTESQFPVTAASAEDAVVMTLFDSTGEQFRTGNATGSDGNFVLPYNWRCSDNQHTFYISSDVTAADGSSFTRVFTTQCIGESDGLACINGEHAEDDKWVCVCPHDYIGKVCDIPVCQNGGSVNSALECDCATNYRGFFCENYDGCQAEADFMPPFNSIASTVIFVVERSAGVVAKLNVIPDETFDNVRAAQYIVVRYGNETEADVIISTTDKSLLAGILKGITAIELPTAVGAPIEYPPAEYFDAIPAIAAALEAQVTDSAQIFWFAETDKADDFVDRLFDPIARQRVSISALFTQTVIDTAIHPVQLAGGNVFYFPTDDPSHSYSDFFTEYVAVLLQFQSTFEFRPNLLSTSSECDATHTVNIDQTAQKLFVAANGEKAEITISTPVVNLVGGAPVDIPGGKVYTFKNTKKIYAGAGTVIVTIKNQRPAAQVPNEDGSTTEAPARPYCVSTVTAFSQNQVAYGFVKDETDTKATITTKKREHLLVTYWTAESAAGTPTPTATITPISRDDGFGNSTELYTTVRNGCSYSLSVPIDCADGVDAIGVMITNWVIPSGGGNGVKVDKYIPVICPAGSCVHGNLTDAGDCECDPFWGGVYCDEQLCKHGIVVGDDCVCDTGYTGADCDVFINPKDRAGIAFLFIQDVCGKDEDLKDTAQSVFASYMDLLTSGDTFYLGTNNPEQSDIVVVKSSKDLTVAMTANRAASGACDASIGAVLDSYYESLRQPSSAKSFMMNAAASDPSLGRARVAHVTTVGVDSDKGSNMGKLSSDYILDMEFIGITHKNEMFPDPDSFKIFPGEFLQTYDPNVALFDLVNTFGSDTKPSTPAQDKVPRCIQNMQAVFVFHTDISSVPKMTEYRSKAQKVIQSVTKYFTIPDVKNIDYDDDTCEFNTDQEKDKTLFYGSIYANSSGIGVPSFCSSNMNTYPGTIASADYKQASQVTLQAVIDSYTKWYANDLKMKCNCFDYANPNTTSIILWTPLSPTSLDTVPVSFDGFNKGGANFHHIVMPFGFNFKDSPLWNRLVPEDQWLPDASQANYDVDQIIQDIWTKTCRLAEKIEKDETAEPFNPYTTKKPRVGEDTWKDDDNAFEGNTELPVAPR